MAATQQAFPAELDLPPNQQVTFTCLKAPQAFDSKKNPGTTRYRYSVKTEHGRMTLWASEELHEQLATCQLPTVTVTKKFKNRQVYFEVIEGEGNQQQQQQQHAKKQDTPSARQQEPTPRETWKIVAQRAVDALAAAAQHAKAEYNIDFEITGDNVQAMIATVLRDTRERGVR